MLYKKITDICHHQMPGLGNTVETWEMGSNPFCCSANSIVHTWHTCVALRYIMSTYMSVSYQSWTPQSTESQPSVLCRVRLIEIRSQSWFRPLCNLSFMWQRFYHVCISGTSIALKQTPQISPQAVSTNGKCALLHTTNCAEEEGAIAMCQSHGNVVMVRKNKYIDLP